jgi:hypothetical protein
MSVEDGGDWRPPPDWRDRLNRAFHEGRARGGLPCCGTTGVEHLPMCSTLKGVSLRRWFEGGTST